MRTDSKKSGQTLTITIFTGTIKRFSFETNNLNKIQKAYERRLTGSCTQARGPAAWHVRYSALRLRSTEQRLITLLWVHLLWVHLRKFGPLGPWGIIAFSTGAPFARLLDVLGLELKTLQVALPLVYKLLVSAYACFNPLPFSFEDVGDGVGVRMLLVELHQALLVVFHESLALLDCMSNH